jgi:hypothetical protein
LLLASGGEVEQCAANIGLRLLLEIVTANLCPSPPTVAPGRGLPA